MSTDDLFGFADFVPVQITVEEWMNPAPEHEGERVLWSDGSLRSYPEKPGILTVMRRRDAVSTT